jgi:thiamine biosynthesis lipoprotein
VRKVAMRLPFSLAVAVCTTLLVPATVHAQGAWRTFSGEAMSTRIQVIVPDRPEAEGDADVVFSIFREAEARLSEWRPNSPLTAVSAGAGGPAVSVPNDVREILAVARRVGYATDGAFDATWAALWGVWDFSEKSAHRVPDPAEIQRRLPLIDYRQIELDPEARTARLAKAGAKLGLGGIAKGWALERAAEALERRGVTAFSLSGGGQVLVRGLKDGRPWRVGVRNPRGGMEDLLGVLEVSNVSVSTSGDYEHAFEVAGVRYHHILDPRTGWPARGLRSATVVMDDATWADALSTAFIVLGRERALWFATWFPGVECLLIDDDGRLWPSRGLVGHWMAAK